MDAAYESTILCDNTQKGNFSVELSPKSNSLRFTFNCTGFVYAYVLGDFNGWRKSDKYKLTWNIDIRDGQIKLIKDVALTNRINNGLCRFSFILIDIDKKAKSPLSNTFFMSCGSFTVSVFSLLDTI